MPLKNLLHWSETHAIDLERMINSTVETEPKLW